MYIKFTFQEIFKMTLEFVRLKCVVCKVYMSDCSIFSANLVVIVSVNKGGINYVQKQKIDDRYYYTNHSAYAFCVWWR